MLRQAELPPREIEQIWQHVGFIHQWLKVRQLKKKLATGCHAMFSNITRWFSPWYFQLLCLRLLQKKKKHLSVLKEEYSSLFTRMGNFWHTDIFFFKCIYCIWRWLFIFMLDSIFHKGLPSCKTSLK